MQALCTAHSSAEQNPYARRLVANTHGVMFIGTPHFNEDDTVEFSKAISILIEGKSKATTALADLEPIRESLSNIASEFHKQPLSLRCLNFVETKEQKYGRRKFHLIGRRERRVVSIRILQTSR